MKTIQQLQQIHSKIKNCRSCTKMCSTPVHGPALDTKVMLIGQAPGAHESERGRPFAYTAGKTLFKWFQQSVGLSEAEVRDLVYIAAVARCFPGKPLKGSGDREPTDEEINNCRQHLSEEVKILKPKIIIAVGKVAIREVLGPTVFTKDSKLVDVVGKKMTAKFHNHEVLVICLPHPSGVSSWPNMEPGKTKLQEALKLLNTEICEILAAAS